MEAVVRLSRGALTVARRRGLGYFGYLTTGVAWPKLTYRFLWGPSAPKVFQRAFVAIGELTAAPVGADELRQRGLLAGDPSAPSTTEVCAAAAASLMDRAHAAGVTGLAPSFRHVVRDRDGVVRFAELTGARRTRPGTMRFAAARDADRRAFNQAFGTTLLTEESARRTLQLLKARVPAGYRDYAPIDFGCGLTIGPIASTDSGTGRWEFFNRRAVAAIVAGKRVLDLGANNGSLPLMMLRAGARAVVAIELTPVIADFARLNSSILSWRDMRAYDIEVLTGDMRQFLTADLGSFDVVTAFCSLYYVPQHAMARIIAKAAAMGAVLVLQANEAIGNLPATAEDLRSLMSGNGYPNVDVIRVPGFARPLLIGRTRQ